VSYKEVDLLLFEGGKKTGSTRNQQADTMKKDTVRPRSRSRRKKTTEFSQTDNAIHGSWTEKLQADNNGRLSDAQATVETRRKLESQEPGKGSGRDAQKVSTFRAEMTTFKRRRETKKWQDIRRGVKSDGPGNALQNPNSRRRAGKQNAPRPKPITFSKLDSKTYEAEKLAKVDVYNYCARLGSIPEFETEVFGATRHTAKHYMVTIKLMEQEIIASARARSLVQAELAACIDFKKKVEKHHSGSETGSLTIDDSTLLNSTNAKDFFSMYKNMHRDVALGVETREIKGKVDAHLTVNGLPVPGEWCVSTSVGKKVAEDLAYLVAAVHLSNSDPDLLPQFQNALSEGLGSILLTPRSVRMEIADDTVRKLERVLKDVRQMGLPRPKTERPAPKESQNLTIMDHSFGLREDKVAAKNAELKLRLQNYMTDPALSKKRALRDSLPMSQHRESVLKHINDSWYSVIVGATGSGKTTQVPQILLEDAIARDMGATCNIVCTQPRRIAATSVAVRVADERGEKLRSSVGYHVRHDPKLPKPGGSITYCTTGILLQRLQRFPHQVLDNLSHIIIDEVHERDIIMDFLMVTLKKIIPARRAAGKSVPKVVLMSATINSELFATYFQETTADGVTHSCPSLSIPGRTFPVKEKYFEDIVAELSETASEPFRRIVKGDRDTADYMRWETAFNSSAACVKSHSEDDEAVINWSKLSSDGQPANEKEDAVVPISLVVATVAHIAKTTTEGAILVFLPGYDEIKKVKTALTGTMPMGIDFTNEAKFSLSTLHSSVPAAEQAAVFKAVPHGCRKVILSTNIAETSVTIPDIQHVVDTGKLREKRYDQVRGITKLQCTWISKSNAKQRAGRAGRVQNGNYYALYTRARFESFRAIGLPEMLRSDLQEVCLDIKAQAFTSPIQEFLAASIEPPSPEAVNGAVIRLKEMQALTEDEHITHLGRLLASLPIHPSLGKMIVLGVIFHCLDPMVILGAAMNERSIFATPPDRKQEARRAQLQFVDRDMPSDHLAFITAFQQMRQILNKRSEREMTDFGTKSYIHVGAFKTINQTTHQIEEVLEQAGLIERRATEAFIPQIGSPELNANSENVNLIKALILAGLHPNLAIPTGVTYRTKREMHTIIHPSSFNFTGYGSDSKRSTSLMSFSSLMKSNDGRSTFLRDTTPVTPLTAILFGGRIDQNGREVTLDKWLPVFITGGPRGSTDKIVQFRETLELLLGTAFADLAHLKQNKVETESSGLHLGEARDRLSMYHKYDKVREAFTQGLVDILDLDATYANPKFAAQKTLNFGPSTAGAFSSRGTSLRKRVVDRDGSPIEARSRNQSKKAKYQ
jgi:ATP-dependent RNA helicase DHX36